MVESTRHYPDHGRRASGRVGPRIRLAPATDAGRSERLALVPDHPIRSTGARAILGALCGYLVVAAAELDQPDFPLCRAEYLHLLSPDRHYGLDCSLLLRLDALLFGPI